MLVNPFQILKDKTSEDVLLSILKKTPEVPYLKDRTNQLEDIQFYPVSNNVRKEKHFPYHPPPVCYSLQLKAFPKVKRLDKSLL